MANTPSYFFRRASIPFAIVLSLLFINPVSAWSDNFDDQTFNAWDVHTSGGGSLTIKSFGSDYYAEVYSGAQLQKNFTTNNTYWSIIFSSNTIDQIFRYRSNTDRSLGCGINIKQDSINLYNAGGCVINGFSAITIPSYTYGTQWYKLEIIDLGTTIKYRVLNQTSGNTTLISEQILTDVANDCCGNNIYFSGSVNSYMLIDDVVASETPVVLNNIYILPDYSGSVCFFYGTLPNVACHNHNFSIYSNTSEPVSVLAVDQITYSFDHYIDGMLYITTHSYSYTPSSDYSIYAYFNLIDYGINNFYIYPVGSGAVELEIMGEYIGTYGQNFSFSVPVGQTFTTTAIPNQKYEFLDYDYENGNFWYLPSTIWYVFDNTTANVTVNFNFTNITPTPTPTATPIPTPTATAIPTTTETPSPLEGNNTLGNMTGNLGQIGNNAIGNITNASNSINAGITAYDYTTHRSILIMFIPAILDAIPTKLWSVIILSWLLVGVLIILRK